MESLSRRLRVLLNARGTAQNRSGAALAYVPATDRAARAGRILIAARLQVLRKAYCLPE